MRKFKVGQLVKVHPDNDNENYDSFRNKTLRITHVATSEKDHPGYDNGLKPEELYDLETDEGNVIPLSLYGYELTSNIF